MADTPRHYRPRAFVGFNALLEDFAGGQDATVHAFAVVPKSVDIERNDHRHADVAHIEIDYRDLPLDPRTVRALAVAIAIGDVTDDESNLGDDPTARRFLGVVDEPETVLEEAGEVVRLTCRDYTAYFLDHTWDGSLIDVTVPLVRVVEAIRDATPGASTIALSWDVGGAAGLVLQAQIGRTKFAPHAGDDTWSVLCDLLGRVGLIPVIKLDELHITSASDVGTGATRWAWGSDVSRLTYRRKFNDVASQQIEIRCWDEQARETRTATWPETAIVKRRKVSASGKVSTEAAALLAFYVAGTYTAAQLRTIAERIYDETAREQFEGEIETHEMLDGDDVDALDVANGDTVEIRLGDGVLASIEGMSAAEAVAFLVNGNEPMDPDVAVAFVASWQRAEQLTTSFYVKSARHTWSREDGYKLEIAFITIVGQG